MRITPSERLQAALALAAALPELAIGTELLAQVCVGLATGVVVVGAAEGGVPVERSTCSAIPCASLRRCKGRRDRVR